MYTKKFEIIVNTDENSLTPDNKSYYSEDVWIHFKVSGLKPDEDYTVDITAKDPDDYWTYYIIEENVHLYENKNNDEWIGVCHYKGYIGDRIYQIRDSYTDSILAESNKMVKISEYD